MKIQELKQQLSSMAEAWSEAEHSKKTLQTEVNKLQTEVQELAVQVQDAFIAEVTEYQQVPVPAARRPGAGSAEHRAVASKRRVSAIACSRVQQQNRA